MLHCLPCVVIAWWGNIIACRKKKLSWNSWHEKFVSFFLFWIVFYVKGIIIFVTTLFKESFTLIYEYFWVFFIFWTKVLFQLYSIVIVAWSWSCIDLIFLIIVWFCSSFESFSCKYFMTSFVLSVIFDIIFAFPFLPFLKYSTMLMVVFQCFLVFDEGCLYFRWWFR